MGLPALIRGKAVLKLERAQAERSSVESLVADLRSKRDALDVEADDYLPTAQSFDAQIAVHERSLRFLDDQIARLEVKADAEARAAAAARRVQAIKTVEAMLPGRLKIIEEIEATVKALPALFDALDKWQREFLRKYPAADVELPYQHFLSDDRVLRNVTAALHQIRIEDAGEQVTGLAEAEAQQHADLIADLEGSPQSEPESEAA